MANRRYEYFRDKFCVKCGSVENLELDHIDPETKVNHAIWSWSEVRRNEELAKCQVLCEVCHLEKTKAWYYERRRHGTLYMYNHIGCRCDKCRLIKSIANRNRKRNRQCPGSSVVEQTPCKG